LLSAPTKYEYQNDNPYYRGSSYATITDFSSAEGDKIQVRSADKDFYSVGTTNVLGFSQTNAVGLYLRNDLVAVFTNAPTITSADFIYI
jgi:hypothetical protein